MDRFPECQAITATWEGTWSNHRQDPGGATMYGVTQAVYDAWRKTQGLKTQSVRLIAKAEVLAIYRRNYWEACGAPDLFPGVDLATYDSSVNSGVSRARKWLASAAGSNDHSVTVKKVCRARLSFMQSLAIWKTFGKGWARRVADIEVKGVAMALQAMGATTEQVRASALLETSAASKTAQAAQKSEKAVAGGGAAGGAAVAYTDTSSIDWTALALLGAVGIAVVAVVIFINVRKRAANERAVAYAELATGDSA